MDLLIQKLHEDATILLEAYSRPSNLYKPRLFRDEGHWCALYGRDLQEGIAGFGITQEEALVDFDKQWCNPPRIWKSIVKFDKNSHHVAPGEYSVDEKRVATWNCPAGYAAVDKWFAAMGVTGGDLFIKCYSEGVPVYSYKFYFKGESFERNNREGLVEFVGGQEIVADLRSSFYRYFRRVPGIVD
ncbi:hypothetical protein [Pseudomonas sp. RL]|uniref:hypothetical protein n=1 Tax=Pseudomonas sp. RL TaxID=1452718 RepID=UPI0012DEB3B1|nr:hypothetical protein [Pseudomonas sp. RL]